MGANGFIRFHHAGDVTVKGGHCLGPRTIVDYELVYFPVGNGTVYECEGVVFPLQVPCVVLTRPGESHSYTFDSSVSTRHLFVHFDLEAGAAEFLSQRYSALLQVGAGVVIPLRSHSLIPQMSKQLMYYFHTRPARWRQLSEMLLLSMMEELAVSGGECGEGGTVAGGINGSYGGDASSEALGLLPSQISAAMKYVEEHITEKVEIADLARFAGWSHEHFTRTFQQHVGYPPKEWMTKRRIEHAAQLLLQRSGSVKSIAREAGFADEYYFHRLFRRWMGMTATEYRRRYGDHRFHELAPPDDWGRFYPLNHFFALDADSVE